MHTTDIVCITSDPQQLTRLSQELSDAGSLVLCKDIQRAESKLQELSQDTVLIIEIAPGYSFEFIDQCNKKIPWIGLCKEENFTHIYNKLDTWKVENILPMPWPENALRNRLQSMLNQESDEEVKALQEELNRTKQEHEAQNSELQQLTSMLEENLIKAESVQEEIVPLMSALINLRIHEPLDEAILPAKLAMRLAKSLNVDFKKRKEIYKAGLLHNIGLIAMPDEILNKPYNQLSAEQQEQFNEIVLQGQAMLDSIPTFEDVALTVRHLYERYDGSGFPDGLKDNDIPLYSRILVPAIDYYELQKGTYFEQQHSPEEALVFILDRSGSRYDPRVVNYLSECLLELDNKLNRVIDHIALDHAKPDMELASSIHVNDNMMLLRRGKKLTSEIIQKLCTVQKDIKDTIMINVYRDSIDEQKAA